MFAGFGQLGVCFRCFGGLRLFSCFGFCLALLVAVACSCFDVFVHTLMVHWICWRGGCIHMFFSLLICYDWPDVVVGCWFVCLFWWGFAFSF